MEEGQINIEGLRSAVQHSATIEPDPFGPSNSGLDGLIEKNKVPVEPEKGGDEGKQPITDPPTENKNGQEPSVPDPQKDKASEEPPVTNWMEELKTKAGREFTSVDELIEELNKKPEPVAQDFPDILKPFVKEGKLSLTKEAEDILRIQASGGNVGEYYRTMAMDFDTMTGKDNQKEMFIRANLPTYHNDRELAELKFNAQYQVEYPNLLKLEQMEARGEDEDVIEQFKLDSRDQLASERKLQARMDQISKEANKKWQQESTTPKETLPARNEGPSPEETAKQNEAFYADLTGKVAQYKGFKIGEGEGAFNVPLDDNVKSVISSLKDGGYVSDYIGSKFGIDKETGQIDLPKFIETIHRLESQDAYTSDKFVKHILEKEKLKTIQAQRENPATLKETASSGELTHDQKIMNAARAMAGDGYKSF